MLSLGQDKDIVVKRERANNKTGKKLIGMNVRVDNAWNINVRNKKSEQITITVYDQIPLTTNNLIEFIDVNTGTAKLDEQTGILKWRIPVEADKNSQLSFSYSVKYPKNKTVIIE